MRGGTARRVAQLKSYALSICYTFITTSYMIFREACATRRAAETRRVAQLKSYTLSICYTSITTSYFIFRETARRGASLRRAAPRNFSLTLSKLLHIHYNLIHYISEPLRDAARPSDAARRASLIVHAYGQGRSGARKKGAAHTSGKHKAGARRSSGSRPPKTLLPTLLHQMLSDSRVATKLNDSHCSECCPTKEGPQI